MPAKSKKQQQFFGAVHQCQKTGKCASPAVAKTAKSIKPKAAKEFAQTKHKGLPKKKHHFDEHKFQTFSEWLEKKDESLWPLGSAQPIEPGLANLGGIGTHKGADLKLHPKKKKKKLGYHEWLEQKIILEK